MYITLDCEIEFRDRVYGTIPSDPEVYKKYLESKFKTDEDKEIVGNDLDLSMELVENSNRFRKGELGFYIADFQVKAMLKQSASLLGLTVAKRGSKQTLAEGCIVNGKDGDGVNTGYRIYFLPFKDDIDGVEEHTGNVSSPQGSRQIISRYDYVENVSAQFTIKFLENRMGDAKGKISNEELKMILDHAAEIGLCGCRKYGGGRFEIKKGNIIKGS